MSDTTGIYRGRQEACEYTLPESVNALESVVQVVQIDPLWIDVPVEPMRATQHRRFDPSVLFLEN